MIFKIGSKVVCKKKDLKGSATERGPSVDSKMKRWAAEQTVLEVVCYGSECETRVRLRVPGSSYYGYWFECEDLKAAIKAPLENK